MELANDPVSMRATARSSAATTIHSSSASTARPRCGHLSRQVGPVTSFDQPDRGLAGVQGGFATADPVDRHPSHECRHLERHFRPFTRCHRSQRPPTYAGDVEPTTPLEDSRGVDVSQLRRQLEMTVPERVRAMVEAANTMLAIQKRAQASLR